VQRTGLTKETLGPDYNLADEPFVAYVPADYDGKTPMGIIVQIFQDGSPEIYQPIRPVLDQQHLIMIATQKDHRPLLTAVGLCLDAVYNLQKTYAIDPSRIFFMGLGQTAEPIGWCTGDVFDGDVYIWWVGLNRQISGMAPLFDIKPPDELMSQVKPHVQILGFPAQETSKDELYGQKVIAGAMRSEGFDNVIVAPVGHDEILEPDWFTKTLKQLESVKPWHPPTAHLASEPSAPMPDEPIRLLKIAQAYISAGATDLARAKLNDIVQKYPDDPAAQKARDLLTQIQGQ
jgi:hypothetical protein